ncbi:hypothetical protein MXB_490 [Myxobolus squamalis]|nr:hypothetical protein MXB_490 [Myxobolus squamalis]
MFVDVGATNTIITVARVGLISGLKKNTTIPSFNITGIGFNAVGASDFDECIKNHLIKEFKKKHKINDDLSKLHKVNVKFMEQAVKAKHLLTSTKQVQLTIEDAYEYITFQTKFDQKTFELTCVGILEKIGDAIDRGYQSSKLIQENLNEVVIMGGGSLIPAVQDFIQKKTGLVPSRVLNTEESNAAGAAFLAAQKHKLFRVIEINSPSSIYYPIEVEYNISVVNHEGVIENKNIRELLYPHLARTTAKKILTLTNVTEDFIIRMRYSQFPVHLNIEELDYRDIMDIHITGVKEALLNNSQHIFKHITVHFRIDSYRMLTVSKVEYFFEKNQTKSIFNKVGQAVMDLFRMNSNQTTEDSVEKSDDPLDLPLNDTLDHSQINQNETLASSPSGSKKENFTIPLPFRIEILYLQTPNDDELFESSLKLKKLYRKEKARQADSKARSDLEHEIFETEKKLRDEELKKYFTDEEYDRAINVTSVVKEIFDLEQHTFNSSVSNEKINQIVFAMSHGLNREKNIKLINEHIFVLADIINKTHQLMAGAIESDGLKSVLNMTQVVNIYNVTIQTKEWLLKKLAEQKSLKLTDTPALTISQLQMKINKLKNLGDSLYLSIQEGLNKMAKDNKSIENDTNATQIPDPSNISDEKDTAKIDL